jgi:hypothetical protein
MTNCDLAIWWLSQHDQEEVLGWIDRGADALSTYYGPDLPNYILNEYVSRFGRSARGRLWVSDELDLPDDFEVANWPLNNLTLHLLKCGGIIIKADDVHIVACLPGIITDLNLNYWRLP